MKNGDIVLFKGKGFLFSALSFLLGLFYSDWRKRSWKPWHCGFIVKIDGDSIVLCEAIQKGVSYIEYQSIENMGDCHIFRWFDNPDEFDIEWWVREHIELPYDSWGYLWTIIGGITMKLFNKPFRIVNKPKFCWENLSEFCRYMGKELQPEEEPILINLILKKLETE